MADAIYVAVVGGYEADRKTRARAEEVGRLLAERGAIVVTGGRSGVSEAAAKGAMQAGGITVGILPGRNRAEANRYLTVAIPTGLGETRNALVVMNGDVVIALPGAYGTLSEIAHALLGDKPVVGLDAWEVGKLGDLDDKVVRADSPQDAVDAALRAAKH